VIHFFAVRPIRFALLVPQNVKIALQPNIKTKLKKHRAKMVALPEAFWKMERAHCAQLGERNRGLALDFVRTVPLAKLLRWPVQPLVIIVQLVKNLSPLVLVPIAKWVNINQTIIRHRRSVKIAQRVGLLVLVHKVAISVLRGKNIF